MKEYIVGNPLFYFLSILAILLTALNIYLNFPIPFGKTNHIHRAY